MKKFPEDSTSVVRDMATGAPPRIPVDVREAMYYLKLMNRFGNSLASLHIGKDEDKSECYVDIKFVNGHRCRFSEYDMFSESMIATMIMFYDLPSRDDAYGDDA